MPPAPPRRRHLAALLLLASLALMLAIGAGLGLAFTEDLVRFTFMRRLCSDDPATQQSGIGYLINHVDDPKVLRHAQRLLQEADGECFDAVVAGLDAGGAWGPHFGPAYLRHLHRRLPIASPRERAGIAVSLATIIYNRRPGHNEPRVLEMIDTLLTDDEPEVRLNALTAAAALPPSQGRPRIESATDDADAAVASRADRLLAPASTAAIAPPDPAALPDSLRQLAELESLEDASITGGPELSKATPPLIRLHLVRVHADADPLALLPVFRSEQPTLRDLATVIACRRFERDSLLKLARALIASFSESHRRAGVILAAMLEPDDELREMIHTRLEHATDWTSRQHARLALWMLDEVDQPDWDPANLLLHREMPRSTLIMAMLHRGDLRGLDWLLGPVGDPGPGSEQALRLMLDTARYHVVIARYLPDAPPFDPWADAAAQLERINWLRDWYLMQRHNLKFDTERRVFQPSPATAD